MSKLAELLHELVDAVHGNKGLTPDRAGELHALADELGKPEQNYSPEAASPAVTEQNYSPAPADGANGG